ncbi:MAG: DegT/DnrJ/EryC1/StrS family aminotransferase [Mariprofundaceae bacterium]
MRIPMVDVVAMADVIRDELIESFTAVITRGDFILGQDVAAFEKEMAEFLGVPECVGVNSGTDALIIGLRAVGVKAGDEVITSPFTFAATAEAIVLIGATPVFVDICSDDLNIDPKEVEKVITSKTKAIIPVHIFGQSAAMLELSELAKKHDLKIVEDVAQATGAEFEGRKLGAWGDAGCFSFFPSKNLSGIGDGGIISFTDPKDAEFARALRNHGQFKRYEHAEIGVNSRLDTIQAGALRIRLRRLNKDNDNRTAVAAAYQELLEDLPLELPKKVRGTHVWHQYVLQLPEGCDRDAVQKYLMDAGIASAVYYPIPLNQQPAFEDWKTECPISDGVATRCLALPIHPLMERAAVEDVAATLRAAITS